MEEEEGGFKGVNKFSIFFLFLFFPRKLIIVINFKNLVCVEKRQKGKKCPFHVVQIVL